MPAYDRGDPPQQIADVLRFLREELTRVEAYSRQPEVLSLQLTELTEAPKPAEAMVVFADGTSWNPGGGRGVYVYSSGAWAKL